MTTAISQSEPALARANGLELAYEAFGARDAPPVLLIGGLGAHMIHWEEEFCLQLAGRGYLVVRYDNRDIGLSSKLEHLGVPDIAALAQAVERGEPVKASYSLQDMAEDAVGLLDALGSPSAHLVGHSMGGLIACEAAISHPARVRTLTVIGSTTGDPSLPPPTPEAEAVLMTPYAPGRQGYIDGLLRTWRAFSGPGLPLDEDHIRRLAGRVFDRGLSPTGRARQMAATLAYPDDRVEALHTITAPTLVIHGAADPVAPLPCGEAVAAAIPGARLVIIEAMGHLMPPAVFPALVDAIATNAV